ncbi:Altered inheritance rate of mitochondria protein 29 [Bienertia sinuspersici]
MVDPNKQLPSLAQLFERTRKRQENKRYADTYDDTARKIEAMKNYTPLMMEVAQRILIWVSWVASSSVNYVVPDEVMDALRVDIQNDKTEIVDMRKELEATMSMSGEAHIKATD